MAKTLAIDFDGVIHKYSEGYKDGEAYDVPMEGVDKALRIFLAQGCKIIIHTTRDLETVLHWFVQHKEMNQFLDFENIPEGEMVGFVDGISYVQKPRANFYIDDRALRFTTWHDIMRYVL